MKIHFYKMPFFFFFFKLGIFVRNISERKVAPSSPKLCKIAFRRSEVLLHKFVPGNGTQKTIFCHFLMLSLTSGFDSLIDLFPLQKCSLMMALLRRTFVIASELEASFC